MLQILFTEICACKNIKFNMKSLSLSLSLSLYIYIYIYIYMDFPCGSDGKESACNAGDLGSIPGLGRSPGEGTNNPL